MTFQLHQPNTLDKVPGLGHLGMAPWEHYFHPLLLTRAPQALCVVWPGGAGVQSARIQPGLALPTQAWLTEIQEYAQHNVVLMLLGNKVDSAQERVVKREDGEKLAKVSRGRVGGQGVPLGLQGLGCPTRLAAAVCRSTGCPSWRPAPRQASTWTWLSWP